MKWKEVAVFCVREVYSAFHVLQARACIKHLVLLLIISVKGTFVTATIAHQDR
jgi:hypothetical protein